MPKKPRSTGPIAKSTSSEQETQAHQTNLPYHSEEAKRQRRERAKVNSAKAVRKAFANKSIMHGDNPATSEVEYTDDELEFIRAVEQYRTKHKRTFPTSREFLRILLSLGYRKAKDCNAPTSATEQSGRSE